MMSVQDSLAAMLHGLTDIDIAYTAEIKELKRKIDYKDGLLKDRDIMDTHEHERYVARANLRIIELEESAESLKKEHLEQMAIRHSEQSELRKTITDNELDIRRDSRIKEHLKKEIKQLKADREVVVAQRQADDREHMLVRNQLGQVTTLYDCEQTESKMLRRKIEDLKKEHMMVRDELTLLSTAHETTIDEADEYKESVAEKAFFIKNLHKEVADNDETIKNLHAVCDSKESVVTELRRENEELKEKLSEPIQFSCSSSQGANVQLRAEIEAIKEDIQTFKGHMGL